MIINSETVILSGTYMIEKKIKVFSILDEGTMFQYEDLNTKEKREKVQFHVRLSDGTEKIWRPNLKSKISLIRLFGTETKVFIGKKIRVMLVPYENKYSIQVDEMETEEMNKSGKGNTLL